MHRNSIDSKQADLVRTIADKGSLTKAAEALFVTQSALSHRLRKLEEQLGIRLFDRSGGALTVTRAGRVVYDYAVKLQQEMCAFDQGLGEVLRKNDYRYTHGYSAAESVRLADQAQTVADYIHHDSYWPAGSTILEVGCGVGTQTKLIAAQNPDCQFIGIDRSESSIRKARLDPELNSLPNVTLEVLDVRQLSRRGYPLRSHFRVLRAGAPNQFISDTPVTVQSLTGGQHPYGGRRGSRVDLLPSRKCVRRPGGGGSGGAATGQRGGCQYREAIVSST